MEILISLISGIIGALLGGILSYLGAINATKKQIDSLYAQEKENRTYIEKKQREALICSFTTEIEENIYLATNLWFGSSHRNIAVNTTSLLSTEAWTTYKGNIWSLPSPLQTKLLSTYAEIRQFNTLVEDARRYAPGNELSLFENLLNPLANKVLENCKAVKEELTIA